MGGLNQIGIGKAFGLNLPLLQPKGVGFAICPC